MKFGRIKGYFIWNPISGMSSLMNERVDDSNTRLIGSRRTSNIVSIIAFFQSRVVLLSNVASHKEGNSTVTLEIGITVSWIWVNGAI